MANSFKHTKCLICNSTEFSPVKKFDTAHLVKCKKCQFVFSENIPTPQELDEHYHKYTRNNFLSPITIKRYEELLDEFEKYRQSNKILDIGCGDGHFLAVALKRGWNVFGTEYTTDAVNICKWKNITMHKGPLNANNYPLDSFDVVTSFEVIEHINNPLEEVQQIQSLLRPGGIFYFTTPNFNSISRFIIGKKWNIVGYPEHLCYFTPKTIHRLLSRSGFQKENITTTGLSITRVKTSLKISNQKLVSNSSDDELIRNKIERYKILLLSKKLINHMLSYLGSGDTIKGFYTKE